MKLAFVILCGGWLLAMVCLAARQALAANRKTK